MHESTAYDMAIEEGEVRRSHQILMLQGARQFGAPDSATEESIRAIQDLERLERMSVAVLTAKS